MPAKALLVDKVLLGVVPRVPQCCCLFGKKGGGDASAIVPDDQDILLLSRSHADAFVIDTSLCGIGFPLSVY